MAPFEVKTCLVLFLISNNFEHTKALDHTQDTVSANNEKRGKYIKKYSISDNDAKQGKIISPNRKENGGRNTGRAAQWTESPSEGHMIVNKNEIGITEEYLKGFLRGYDKNSEGGSRQKVKKVNEGQILAESGHTKENLEGAWSLKRNTESNALQGLSSRRKDSINLQFNWNGKNKGQSFRPPTGQVPNLFDDQDQENSANQSGGDLVSPDRGNFAGQNFGNWQNFLPKPGQNAEQVFGQNSGQNSGQKFGQNSGQNFGQKFGQSSGQNSGQKWWGGGQQGKWRENIPKQFIPGKNPTEPATSQPVNFSTSSPMNAPTTRNPTKSPTITPATNNPTNSPNRAPTASPTEAPTKFPVLKPTLKPTPAPTSKPTSAPTNRPTSDPTSNPTSAPTNKPTSDPTPKPMSPTDRSAPQPGSFSITLQNMGPPNDKYDRLFRKAKERWEAIIINDLPDIGGPPSGDWFVGRFGNENKVAGPVDDILIGYKVDSIDGIGGTLGEAGPTFVRSDQEGILWKSTIAGTMNFDKDDFEGGEYKDQDIELIILHEMGHCLGIGTFWVNNCGAACFSQGIVSYTCDKAKTEFANLGVSGRLMLESEGGGGTACSHWNENSFSDLFSSELMTGTFEPGKAQPLSRVSAAALEDLGGYEVNYEATDPYPTLTNLQAKGTAAKGAAIPLLPSIGFDLSAINEPVLNSNQVIVISSP